MAEKPKDPFAVEQEEAHTMEDVGDPSSSSKKARASGDEGEGEEPEKAELREEAPSEGKAEEAPKRRRKKEVEAEEREDPPEIRRQKKAAVLRPEDAEPKRRREKKDRKERKEKERRSGKGKEKGKHGRKERERAEERSKGMTPSPGPFASTSPAAVASLGRFQEKAFQRDRMAEILKLMNSTECLIPKASFQRLVKSILLELQHQKRQEIDPHARFEEHHDMRMESQALFALQEAAEQYMVGLMEDANACAAHNRRITIMEKDIMLVQRLTRCKLMKVIVPPQTGPGRRYAE